MIDDKRELIRAFDSCLAAFPSGKGRRNCELLPRAACLACKLGMGEDAFTGAIQGVAPDMSAAEVRRTFRTARPKIQLNDHSKLDFLAWHPKTQTKSNATTFPHHVRNLIHAGRDVRTIEELMRLSVVPVAELSPREQLMHQLWWLFPEQNDVVYIFRNNPATPGVLGRTLMRVNDWLNERCPNPPLAAGELVVPNPFTGEMGATADGKQSYIAQSCLAAFPHMVIEFDEMPLETQCQFWAGFILKSKLPLMCLTYSGGKSIHGCVHIGAADIIEHDAKKVQMAALFASDNEAAFRADAQSMRPRTGTRLAGAIRKETGKLQQLVWACGWNQAPKTRKLAVTI